ncbi:MAG: DUF924 domain-containing protein [Burkholderiales bacterium]|nr:DUF924 domain-containing protein [Burkholderiales bacterium]
MAAWQPILDFWYLPPGDPGHGKSRPEWFRKDAAFDLLIRERFGDRIEQALAGGFLEWDGEPRGALARIILLDQFTRNAFRDTPRAFAGDPLALPAALALVGTGGDRLLAPVERWFVYLPLEHAEDIAIQERSVALFNALAAEPGMEGIVEYAVRHRDIVARFGRFPHRNRILGRASTPEEEEFLKQPGSGF